MSGGTNPRAPKVPSRVVVVGLEPDLFAAAANQVAQQTGGPATARTVFDHTVGAHLAGLVGCLRGLGFRGGPKGKRRPRRINQAAWDSLQAAAAETGIPAPALLRACLQRTAET